MARWLLLVAVAGCGFELTITVYPDREVGSFELDGQSIDAYEQSYHYASFESSLDHPPIFRVTQGDETHAFAMDGHAACVSVEDRDFDEAWIRYYLEYDGDRLYLSTASGTCRDGDNTTIFIVD